MFENPRRSRQARNFTENDPKILDLKSSSEQIIVRKLSLGAPDVCAILINFLWFIKKKIATIATIVVEIENLRQNGAFYKSNSIF